MENQSGFKVVQDKVLLFPDRIGETAGEFIVKPDVVREQEKWAQTRATIIDIGPNAFEAWDEPKPQVGDRVFVCKYAGIDGLKGADDKYYKIAPDQDIIAIIEKDPENAEVIGSRQPLGG